MDNTFLPLFIGRKNIFIAHIMLRERAGIKATIKKPIGLAIVQRS